MALEPSRELAGAELREGTNDSLCSKMHARARPGETSAHAASFRTCFLRHGHTRLSSDNRSSSAKRLLFSLASCKANRIVRLPCHKTPLIQAAPSSLGFLPIAYPWSFWSPGSRLLDLRVLSPNMVGFGRYLLELGRVVMRRHMYSHWPKGDALQTPSRQIHSARLASGDLHVAEVPWCRGSHTAPDAKHR